MNIFVFVFGSKYDPEYIRIRIRAKKNSNIFILKFGPKNNIRYTLGHNRPFYNGHYGHLDHLADMISLNMFTNMLLFVSMERMWITCENGIEKMHRIESYD